MDMQTKARRKRILLERVNEHTNEHGHIKQNVHVANTQTSTRANEYVNEHAHANEHASDNEHANENVNDHVETIRIYE